MTMLPWHEPLVRNIRARLAASALPHALLLTGPEGWGEVELANWLALELLGLDDDRDAAVLAHPDLRWVEPEKAIIPVGAVRELVAFAQGTPQAGPRKVAVLVPAHALNQNAANALLKTLEEPPPGTHLLLVSSHPGQLLPTIRSRCQVLTIRPDPAVARPWLERQAGGADVSRLSFEYGDAPVAVLAALERGEQPLDELIERWLDEGASRRAVETLIAAGLVNALGRWYRYVLAMAAGTWWPGRLGAVSRRALMAFGDEISDARRQLVTTNSAAERLLAERVLVCWKMLAAARRP